MTPEVQQLGAAACRVLKGLVQIMKKRIKWILIIVTLIIVTAAGGFFIFVNTDKYHRDETALAAASSDIVVTVTEADGKMVFSPHEPEYGLIFYPGGKVEYSAYAPLMRTLAQKNVLCIITQMPFDLAIFNRNAADGIQEAYPSVRHWYIGGHSLGGVMAASYAANHTNTLDGLILLAAYTTADLSKTDLNVISIYGSNDGVLNMQKYRESLPLLPQDKKELVINGGCHAYFGSYGFQKGDGKPTITPSQQIELTADFIVKCITHES